MTNEEARLKANEVDSLIAELHRFMHDRFNAARTPIERDYCFGYSCGMGINACANIAENMNRLRVSLMQVEDAQKNR